MAREDYYVGLVAKGPQYAWDGLIQGGHVRLGTVDGGGGLIADVFETASHGRDERVTDIVDGIVSHLHVQPDMRHIPPEEARAKMGTFAEAGAVGPSSAEPARNRAPWLRAHGPRRVSLQNP